MGASMPPPPLHEVKYGAGTAAPEQVGAILATGRAIGRASIRPDYCHILRETNGTKHNICASNLQRCPAQAQRCPATCTRRSRATAA